MAVPECSVASSSSPKRAKLQGYDFYKTVLGSPKYIVAPMVDQSELAWRILSRRYGAQVVYTPMINAKMFCDPTKKSFREQMFNLANAEEGSSSLDRPLVIQFCGNNPDQILASAKALQDHCDAIDINLGCPQEIARRGRYGSFLQDEWELIEKMIKTLHENLDVPVTAKFRVFPSLEKTVQYAQMLERAGAQILTCHGRTREQRGQISGLADWAKIRAVKAAVSVPVFANGNILFHADIDRCLAATGADAVMSAEGQLYNAALFASSPSPSSSLTSSFSSPHPLTTTTPKYALTSGYHPPHCDLALEYLDIVRTIKTRTAFSAVKGHLFKLLRPALGREKDLREQLGRVAAKDFKKGMVEYEGIVGELKGRMDRDAAHAEAEGKTLEELITVDPVSGLQVLPHWLAQPYVRPAKAPEPVPAEKRAAPIPVEDTTASSKRPRLGEDCSELLADPAPVAITA